MLSSIGAIGAGQAGAGGNRFEAISSGHGRPENDDGGSSRNRRRTEPLPDG
jgi:hypothetical protein